ncbi:hypothetical protein Btru_011326 [Bulinus truncatus]|nr:hypothetical protein Btru_011326 [Bulinus truncatus]
MSIVIGGGTGFIGRHVSRLATSKGFKVISVSRKAAPNCMTWNDVTRSGLPSDCVAVVSMSGEPVLQPFKKWTDDFKTTLKESRINLTKTLKQAVLSSALPPKVFVSLSGIGYYKEDQHKEYTENDRVEPHHFLSELCKEWEEAARLPENSSTRSVIVRTGVVLGNDGGVIQNIKMPFYLGLGGPIGSGKQWFSWIHVEDMAGIIVYAIENDHVKGILNGTSPNPVRSEEFTKAYASALCRPHLVPLPSFAANAMFGKEGGAVLLEGQKVLPKRTLELGYQFKYPSIESACKQLVS